MRTYRTGQEFEIAVFGKSSEGLFKRRFSERKVNFEEGIKANLQLSGEIHPPTQLGECLYGQTAKELDRFGIGSRDLILSSSVGTGIDLFHFTDGFFGLLSIPAFVSIDTFNMGSNPFSLKMKWIDTFKRQFYSEAEFQSDLFNYSEGFSAWRRAGGDVKQLYTMGWDKIDFRCYTERQNRPENHFVLTPYHAGTYRRRRDFAKLVAGYFAKAAKESSHENMALLSH